MVEALHWFQFPSWNCNLKLTLVDIPKLAAGFNFYVKRCVHEVPTCILMSDLKMTLVLYLASKLIAWPQWWSYLETTGRFCFVKKWAINKKTYMTFADFTTSCQKFGIIFGNKIWNIEVQFEKCSHKLIVFEY